VSGLIALLVALVATIQIRSQAEVEAHPGRRRRTSLAFLIDDLHRANDSLGSEREELTRRQGGARLGAKRRRRPGADGRGDPPARDRGLIPVRGPGIVMVIDAAGLTALDMQDALNNLAAAVGRRSRSTDGGWSPACR